jgi:hypothetical protein
MPLAKITALFPLLFGLVTSNFNLTDPRAIGMLIQGDHWSHACTLSRILDPLERGEVHGDESHPLDPLSGKAPVNEWTLCRGPNGDTKAQHAHRNGNYNSSDTMTKWQEWRGVQHGKWTKRGGVWAPHPSASQCDANLKLLVTESSAIAHVLAKLDDIKICGALATSESALEPQSFVSHLQKVNAVMRSDNLLEDEWGLEDQRKFEAEEVWAKRMRCGKSGWFGHVKLH